MSRFMSSPAIRVQYYSTQTLTYQTAGHFTVPPSTKIHPVRVVWVHRAIECCVLTNL